MELRDTMDPTNSIKRTVFLQRNNENRLSGIDSVSRLRTKVGMKGSKRESTTHQEKAQACTITGHTNRRKSAETEDHLSYFS